MTINAATSAPEVLTKDVHLQFEIVKQYKAKTGEFFIEGFGVTTDIDLENERFADNVLEDIAKSLLECSTVFYNHDYKKEIGAVKETKVVKGKGVWMKILVSKTVPDIIERIKEGILTGLSIGGKVTAKVKEYVENLGKSISVITGFKAFEVSIVGLPANPKARSINWYIKSAFKDGGENMSKPQEQAAPAEGKAPETVVKTAPATTPETTPATPPTPAAEAPKADAAKAVDAEKSGTPAAPEATPSATTEKSEKPAETPAAPAAAAPTPEATPAPDTTKAAEAAALEVDEAFLTDAAIAAKSQPSPDTQKATDAKQAAAMVDNIVASLTKVRNSLLAAGKSAAKAEGAPPAEGAAAEYGYGFPAGLDPKKVAATIDSQIAALTTVRNTILALAKGIPAPAAAPEAKAGDAAPAATPAAKPEEGGEQVKSLLKSNEDLSKQVSDLTKKVSELSAVTAGSKSLKGQEGEKPAASGKKVFKGLLNLAAPKA
jgi:HK97 family phage prohead protease